MNPQLIDSNIGLFKKLLMIFSFKILLRIILGAHNLTECELQIDLICKVMNIMHRAKVQGKGQDGRCKVKAMVSRQCGLCAYSVAMAWAKGQWHKQMQWHGR